MAGVRNKAWLIFMKEIRVILRDRRMVMGIVLGGLVVFPLLMALIGSLGEDGDASVTVVLYEPDAELLRAAGTLEGASVMSRQGGGPDLPLPDGPRLSAGVGTDGYWLEASRANPVVWSVARALEEALVDGRSEVVRRRLELRGVPPSDLEPYSIRLLDTSDSRDRSAAVLAVLVPYLAIIILVSNAIRATYIAVGEKEKNTLASLLVTSVPRSSIVLGKTLAVMAVAVSASTLLVVGMVAFSALGLSIGESGLDGGYRPGVGQFALVAANLSTLSLLVAGAIMAIGTFARTQREAGYFTAPLLFLCIFLAVFSFSPRAFPLWTNAVPVLVNALAMRDAILTVPAGRETALAALGNVLVFAVLIGAAVRMYRKESILFRT
jgi:sodium transport system permease protein